MVVITRLVSNLSRLKSTMAAAIDEKSTLCIPFILKRLEEHRRTSQQPFFIGLNGVQGAGKTTLVGGHFSLQSKSLSVNVLAKEDIRFKKDILAPAASL